MGNKLRNEGDEVRIKVIWPDGLICSTPPCQKCLINVMSMFINGFKTF